MKKMYNELKRGNKKKHAHNSIVHKRKCMFIIIRIWKGVVFWICSTPSLFYTQTGNIQCSIGIIILYKIIFIGWSLRVATLENISIFNHLSLVFGTLVDSQEFTILSITGCFWRTLRDFLFNSFEWSVLFSRCI